MYPFKYAKQIRIDVEGTPFLSNRAPVSIDDFDGSCPSCGSSKYEETVTIIQHGMDVDACLTVCHCGACQLNFHYVYEVPAAALDEVVNRH